MSKDLPGLSTMSLKMDMLRIQDEILRDMRQMQVKFDNKYSRVEEELNGKLTKFDLKINNLEKKISELSNLITEENSMKDKIESLFHFKEEIQDTIFKRRAKFAELEKKVNSDIDEINKILINTVIYPAMVGKTAKFQTFHELIDYVIQEINQLNLFKNKINLDSMTSFKKKIDGTLDTFKILINNLTPKEVTEQMVNDLEQKINSTLKIYDDRLQDTRVENSHYSMGIEKKAEELKKQIENLKQAHSFINKKMEKIQNLENYNILSNELLSTNQRIIKIFDILRDLSLFHPDVKKKYPSELDKKIGKKIISGVRQYIKGNLNADELTTMKKFAFEKTKAKLFEKTYPAPKATQNVVSENQNTTNNPVQKRQSYFVDSRPKNNNSDLNTINKKFMSKKSINYSKQENIMPLKFTDSEKVIKKSFYRKNTFSFGKNALKNESSKLNDYLQSPVKNIDIFNIHEDEKVHNVIEEENEVNNFSYNSNNNINENKNQSSFEKNNNKSVSIKYEKKESKSKKDEKNDSISFIKNNEEDKENNINEINNKVENNKNNNINIHKKEPLKNNNNNLNNEIKNFNTKKEEKKKLLILNLNKNYNQSPEPKKQEKEKEITHNIFTETENTNTHARNNKILTLDNDTNRKTGFITNLKSNLKISSNIHNINNKTTKSRESPKSNSREKNTNQTSENNKILIPINYNFKSKDPDISVLSIKKKMYKTFNNFPRVKQDISEQKLKLNNNTNISIPISKENNTRTLNENNFYRKEPYIVSTNRHPKKILLMNPDELPLNYFDKAYKDLMKNNPFLAGYQSERIITNKNKDINIFNSKGNEHSINK